MKIFQTANGKAKPLVCALSLLMNSFEYCGALTFLTAVAYFLRK